MAEWQLYAWRLECTATFGLRQESLCSVYRELRGSDWSSKDAIIAFM